MWDLLDFIFANPFSDLFFDLIGWHVSKSEKGKRSFVLLILGDSILLFVFAIILIVTFWLH